MDIQRLVAGLSPRRPEFSPRPVRVKFVLIKIARDRLFYEYLAFRCHCRSTSSPYLFTHHRRQIILATDIVIK